MPAPDLLADAASAMEKIRRWRPEVTGPLAVQLFDAAMTAAFASNLLDAAQQWRPDLIVRETNEYGGYLAADALNVPLAMVDIAPLIVPLVPDLTEQLDALRTRFGLPALTAFAADLEHVVAGSAARGPRPG